MSSASPAVIGGVRSTGQLVFRSFPFPCEPGLRTFGTPDRKSPVFVTCNFDHTVRLVSRVLRGYDCYLLVAPTGGMNVWCASAGGHFGTDEVEAAIKLSDIGSLVDHHRLILPRLASPGVDPAEVRRRTGWGVSFGPIDIGDLPAWLAKGTRALTPDRVSFPLSTRVEMGIGAALWPAVLLGIPTALLGGWKAGVLTVALAYALSVAFAVGYPYFPLEPGLPQAFPTALLLGAGAALVAVAMGAGLLSVVLWGVALALMGLLIATDFPSWSPTDVCKQKLLCFLYPATLAPSGFLPVIDEPTCIDSCNVCVNVCPKGALVLNEASKATLIDPAGCISCYACVQQCPVDAIS